MYNKKVMERFKNPKNLKEMKEPDAIGKIGNIHCGDVMWCFIKIEENKKGERIIKDISIKTFGCVAAMSTSDVLCDLVRGKSIKESLNIKDNDIIMELGELPVRKIHCSLLAVDALGEAIYNYLLKSGLPIPSSLKQKHERIKNNLEIINKRQNY
ncbi:MAG: iron-sulfur cluster assembly scaffold protein [Candidatus Aenigmarchaeota archaeon]|nr:iron-sulfur cluster assembly scaffold protein [Candidatus Aenigmarchaeota archaeon]